MVFIGPRGVTKTRTRGLFRCPHCNASRAYAHRRVRRFFALFYLPIIPLKGEREFVQCRFCRRAFAPSILESAPPDDGSMVEEPTRATRRSENSFSGPAASRLLVWDGQAE